MGHFQEGEPQFFQIGWMAHATQGKPIVDLIELGRALADRQEQNPCIIREGDDRAAQLELLIQIVAAVTDRLDPFIWLFIHDARPWLRTAVLTARPAWF